MCICITSIKILYMNIDLIKKGISQPCFYGDVINRAKKFKSDTSKLVKSLKTVFAKAMI